MEKRIEYMYVVYLDASECNGINTRVTKIKAWFLNLIYSPFIHFTIKS